MSDDFYQKYWIATKKQLEDLDLKDKFVIKNLKQFKEREPARDVAGWFYARYSLIIQKIDQCLNQLCHVQKRFTIRKMMDAATIRLNEFKEALTEIDLSEYHYVDGNLIELKIVPHQIEILHPTMFYERSIEIEDMWIKIQKGERIFVAKQELDDQQLEEEETESITKPEVVQEVEKQEEKDVKLASIAMIQTAERARQSRLYVNEMNAIYLLKRGPKSKATSSKNQSETFAINTQKLWRGHRDREFLKRREAERRFLIGMIEPSWKSTKEFDKVKRTVKEKQEKLDQRIREYVKANLDEKDRVVRIVGPGLMEDIGDEIREWFRIWYREIRTFDKIPPPAQGGTIMVIRGETMTPKDYLAEQERLRKEKESGKAKNPADLAKEKAKEKAAAAAAKKKEKENLKKEAEAAKKRESKGLFEFKLEPSANEKMITDAYLEHFDLWDKRNDVEENPLQKHYMDMITEQKCYELQLEVRAQVDELMKLELQLLTVALEKDKWKAKGAKGTFKPKQPKPPKAPKAKKNKDPTANRTTEDLFQELVDNHIIRTYPYAELTDYIGDFSYKNWNMRNMHFDPPPTLGDVRQAIVLNCIAPLGVTSMVKPKSVLIAGARQSGKHVLANAIFNATRCVLFDISPKCTAESYPGKKGAKMLAHLILKMSRILQPSIIFIDGGEKPFYKKVPKEERAFQPKKLGGLLVKNIIKPILPEDRVLVLAISKEPFNGNAGKMKKAYEKIILIPRPDYGSVYLYWRRLLLPYHGIDRNINMSTFCSIAQNYPLSQLKEALEKVLTAERIVQLSYRPIDPHEILDVLLDMPEPITEKEWTKFVKWFSKTPLQKRREILNQNYELLREAEEKAAQKTKK